MPTREVLDANIAEARRLSAGGVPDPKVLAAAPLLDEWWVNPVQPGVYTLSGHCTGHPTLRDGPATTSVALVLPKDVAWALTASRYYRLGHPKYLDDEMKAELAESERKRLNG